MNDHVVGYLLFVPVSIIIVLLMAMVLIGLSEEESSNPIDRIPKVVFDYVDGTMVISVMGFGEHRYDAIHINYTADNHSANTSVEHRYAIDAVIPFDDFVLNVTAISGSDTYMLNCTVEVVRRPTGDLRLRIQEEDDNKASDHRFPYTLLAEWRDLE